MLQSRSQFVMIRGLRYHVRSWGEERSPTLFLLHGWMDVSASFQFLVDAFRCSWRVLAPDWRGFGMSAWSAQGYWFADYLADLDALVDYFSAGESVNLVGHSLGGNVVGLYAGLRPQRVRRAVSIEGFGIPAERPERAPAKLCAWLDGWRARPQFKPYASLAAVADRLQRNNARLARDRAEFLAAHWAQIQDDGNARLRSDPLHKLPFPTVYRVDEVFAVWRQATAPMLWIGAEHSTMPHWLAQADSVSAYGMDRRKASWRDLRYVEIADAGHMVHHDQPEAVAGEIERFLSP